MTGFVVYFLLDELFFYGLRSSLHTLIDHLGTSHFVAYVLVGIPIVAAAIAIHGKNKWIQSLGLYAPTGIALVFSLICTLPMLLGYALSFDFNKELSLNEILISVIFAAFFEEVYFRGFLFGQIFRFTRVGFILAILIGALLFASVHLYQSQELSTLFGIFLTTFSGAIWFAWLYVEWNHNLWIPIFLHLFMNLFWLLFSVSDNALGGETANIFRILTIALSVGLTIFYKRKKGMKLEVNRHTIWMKDKKVEYRE